jgi:aspartate carbamoyltransferase catalytic subunit
VTALGTSQPASQPAPAAARSAVRLQHLLTLRGQPPELLRDLLSRARDYAKVANEPSTNTRELAGRTIATLFFEDSTRTRTSFTLAARRLGADVIDVSGSSTSVNKGESLVDTARTIAAMGVSAMVIRAKPAGAPADIARAVGLPIINAGDGKHEHPTQGLLDILTIAQAHGRATDFDLSGLRIAIVGDIANSRVARSGIAGLTALGARVVCVGPPALAPRSLATLGCEVSSDLDSLLGEMDAVMMLRIQFERHAPASEPASAAIVKPTAAIPSIREYREFYGLTEARAARLKSGAVVLHPGPFNRGVEIDDAVADGARSLILRQVANGVAVRMAVLAAVMGE